MKTPTTNTSTKPANPVVRIIIAFVVALFASGLAFGVYTLLNARDSEAQLAPSLQLSGRSPESPVTIGVIVSHTENKAEGAGWEKAASGAQVAAWRANQTGEKIKLQLVSDKGSVTGARDAVRELIDEGAVAAVVATSGPHTTALAMEAEAHGLPLVFLYHSPEENFGTRIWALPPTLEESRELIRQDLEERGLEKPVTILPDSSKFKPIGLSISYRSDEDFSTSLLSSFNNEQFDAVIIDGHAEDTAKLVATLRSHDISLPIYLLSAGQNPLFQDTLISTGTSAGDITTIGEVSADILALEANDTGAQASNFMQALNIMSANSSIMSLDDSQPFRAVAAYADVRSHDVVLAIYAASRTGDLNSALHSLSERPEGAIGANFVFDNSRVGSSTFVKLVQATATPSRMPIAWFSPQEPEEK